MTSAEQNIFFELLRASIWQREVDVTSFCSLDWQWQNIFNSLESHALLAFAADAIMNVNEHLPQEQKLSTNRMMGLMQHCATVAQTHYELNAAIVSSFSELQSASCTPILLKGQGLASYYPIKNTRSCGDIDIYVGHEKYETAKEIIKSHCTKEEINCAEEDSHQYHINCGHVIFEVHPIAGHSADSSCQNKYNNWTEKWLCIEKCESIFLDSSINRETHEYNQVLVPNVQFNVVYVFDHLCRHLHFQGVGIRQFVDVAVLLKSAYGKLDEALFMYDIKQLGLLRAWKILSGILVYNLGLPECMCPFFDRVYASKSQGHILDTTLQDSNFGADSEWRHEASRLSHGKERMQMKLSEQWQIFRINYLLFPRVAVSDLVNIVYGGMVGFFKRLLK